MRRTLLVLSALFLTASSWAAMESVETLRAGALGGFEGLAHVRLKPEAAKAVVNLSGYLNLDGSGYVSNPHGGSVMITLRGSTNLSDPATGASATAYFNETQTFFVNGNFVSGYVYPRQYVQVTRNGRSVGSLMVSGSIYVSGFLSGGWVRLSGSGQVSGSGPVQDK